MKHPIHHARITPDKIAYKMAKSGAEISYGELDIRSNQCANALRLLGVGVGDHIAILLENRLEMLEICWAAQRSGVIFTLVSRYLQVAEAAYIVEDCGAKIFITSDVYGELGAKIRQMVGRQVGYWMVGDAASGFDCWDELTSRMPSHPVKDECAGTSMLYSSGTTGRPKGIVRTYPNAAPLDSLSPILVKVFEDLGQMNSRSVYLSPAPLYHSAPLGAALVAAGLGATTIIMEKFDEEEFLANIEHYKITHTQLVPTMFVRMLKLAESIRRSYNLSSLTCAIHVAAPCPVEIKRQMIEWWGPIILEYYAGTEGNGVTAASSAEWLAHPGTVGKPMIGSIHILGDDGNELPVGEVGDVYFNAGMVFSYHNDPDKTAKVFTKQGWSTLGDIGWLDHDGFLHLSDRRSYMIISGGVNVYPQETENLMVTHPAIVDVAVFGVPNEELGEEVKAVVQPVNFKQAGAELEAELIGFCRQHLSAIKTPKSIDFRRDLPRTPTGKLIKRHLKAEYWPSGR